MDKLNRNLLLSVSLIHFLLPPPSWWRHQSAASRHWWGIKTFNNVVLTITVPIQAVNSSSHVDKTIVWGEGGVKFIIFNDGWIHPQRQSASYFQGLLLNGCDVEGGGALRWLWRGSNGSKGDRGHWSICCCEAADQSNVPPTSASTVSRQQEKRTRNVSSLCRITSHKIIRTTSHQSSGSNLLRLVANRYIGVDAKQVVTSSLQVVGKETPASQFPVTSTNRHCTEKKRKKKKSYKT